MYSWHIPCSLWLTYFCLQWTPNPYIRIGNIKTFFHFIFIFLWHIQRLLLLMDYFMSIRTWKTNNKHLHVHTRTITVSSTHAHQSVTYTYFLVFLPHTAKRVWASKYHTWNFLILSYPKAIFLKTKKIPGQHTVLNRGVVRHSWERASQEKLPAITWLPVGWLMLC